MTNVTKRYLIMRLHTAQHIMNGIIWRDNRAHVTGAQITPPQARLDFELPAISPEFARSVETAVNGVVAENLPVRVGTLSSRRRQRNRPATRGPPAGPYRVLADGDAALAPGYPHPQRARA